MRRVLFIIAFVILSNPLLSSFDVLPDLIAYILILIALSKSTYISARAKQAYVVTRNMLIVSLVKIACMYFDIMSPDDTLSLVFSFGFCIIELIFGIPFILKIFEYFSSIVPNGDEKLSYRVDAVKVFTIIAFSIKMLFSTAPDLIILTRPYEFISFSVDYSMLRYPLIVLSIILYIPLMVIWIVKETRLIKRLFTKELDASIGKEFNKKIENKALHYEIKSNEQLLLFLGISSAFAFTVKIDNVNIFYNSIIPLVFIGFFVALWIMKRIKKSAVFYALCGVSAVQLALRITEAVLTKDYFTKYNMASCSRIPEAYMQYFYRIVPVTAFETLFFAGCVGLIVYLLIKNADDCLQKNLPILYKKDDFAFTLNEYRKKVLPFGIATTVLALLSAIFYPIMIATQPFLDEMVRLTIGNKIINLPIYSWIMPTQVTFTIAFVVAFISTLVVIRENSYKRLYTKISLD